VSGEPPGLADGYHPVGPGKLAAVVTSLEMTARPALRPEPAPVAWSLRHERAPTAAWYRDLFARMGRDWLWFSRLGMDEAELTAIVTDPKVEIHVLEFEGRDEGYVELDFRQEGECEVAFFAVGRELQGRGAGRWLMNRGLERAWSRPIGRLWVHTCTLDHPGALAFYQRSGFVPYRRQVEIGDDPRLSGRLPHDPETQAPLL
jgi:GNAT superfamily N-acetyltransferase